MEVVTSDSSTGPGNITSINPQVTNTSGVSQPTAGSGRVTNTTGVNLPTLDQKHELQGGYE